MPIHPDRFFQPLRQSWLSLPFSPEPPSQCGELNSMPLLAVVLSLADSFLFFVRRGGEVIIAIAIAIALAKRALLLSCLPSVPQAPM